MVSVKFSKKKGEKLWRDGILKSSKRRVLKIRVGAKSEEIKFEVTFSGVFQDLHKLKMKFCSKAFIPSHCWRLGRKGECRIRRLRL